MLLAGQFPLTVYAQPTRINPAQASAVQNRHLLNGHLHRPGSVLGSHLHRPHIRPPIVPGIGAVPGILPGIGSGILPPYLG